MSINNAKFGGEVFEVSLLNAGIESNDSERTRVDEDIGSILAENVGLTRIQSGKSFDAQKSVVVDPNLRKPEQFKEKPKQILFERIEPQWDPPKDIKPEFLMADPAVSVDKLLHKVNPQTNTQINTQANAQINSHINPQSNTHANTHTNTQANAHTNTQTNQANQVNKFTESQLINGAAKAEEAKRHAEIRAIQAHKAAELRAKEAQKAAEAQREAQLRAIEAHKAAERAQEAQKIAEAAKIAEAEKAKEALKASEAAQTKKSTEPKSSEEAQRAAAAAQAARLAEAQKAIEAARAAEVAEAARKAEAQKAEEASKAAEALKIAEAKMREEAEKAAEAQRAAEALKAAETQMLKEADRIVEERKFAEEQRLAEERRLEEERILAEELRLAEEHEAQLMAEAKRRLDEKHEAKGNGQAGKIKSHSEQQIDGKNATSDKTKIHDKTSGKNENANTSKMEDSATAQKKTIENESKSQANSHETTIPHAQHGKTEVAKEAAAAKSSNPEPIDINLQPQFDQKPSFDQRHSEQMALEDALAGLNINNKIEFNKPARYSMPSQTPQVDTSLKKKYDELLAMSSGLVAENEDMKSKISDVFNQNAELTLACKRLQADFDNYRRRNNENLKNIRLNAVIDVVEKFLPTLDVIDSAIVMIKDPQVAGGIKMMRRQLMDVFASYDVREIEALGKEFDPNIHEAVLSEDNKEMSGKVLEVLRKGYKMGDKVLRYSQVKVAK